MVILNLENGFACGFLFLQAGELEDPEVYLPVGKTYTLFPNFRHNFRKESLSLTGELNISLTEVSMNVSDESDIASETQPSTKGRLSRTLKIICNIVAFP